MIKKFIITTIFFILTGQVIYSQKISGFNLEKMTEMGIRLNKSKTNMTTQEYTDMMQRLTQSGYFDTNKISNKKPEVDYTSKKGDTPSQKFSYRIFGPFLNWLYDNNVSPFWFILFGFGLYFVIKRSNQIQKSESIKQFWENLSRRERRKLYFEIFFVVLNLVALILTQVSMSRMIYN